MSPGPAARLLAANGRRAFVTACGAPLNPETPGLLRAEADVLSVLPAHPSLPALCGAFDDGEWVALLVEDLEDVPRRPWRRADLERVSTAFSAVRCVLDAAPVRSVPRARDSSPVFGTRWRELSGWVGRLGPWRRGHHDVLASCEIRIDSSSGRSIRSRLAICSGLQAFAHRRSCRRA
jgi:hypothetical protein